MIKIVNISLIVISILLFSESTLNLMGRKALLEGNFGKAQSYLSLIRNKELLGLVFYKQDKFEQAYNFYKQINNWKGMGWAYYGMGKLEEARDYFKRVNDLAGLGQVELAKGNYTKAKEIFTQTQDKSGLGLTHLADGDYKRAKKYFIETGDELGLGLTYFAKGDFKSAKTVFSTSKNKTVAGLLHLIKNKLNNAIHVFEKLNDNLLLGSSLLALGNYDKALEVFLENNNYKESVRVLLETKRFTQAMEIAEKSENEEAMAEIYFHLGQYEKSFEIFDSINKYQEAVTCLITLGNKERALKYIRQIVKQNSEDEYSILLAELIRLSGNYDLAQIQLDQLKKQKRLLSKVKVLQVRLLFSREDPKKPEVKNLLQSVITEEGSGLFANSLINSSKTIQLKLAPPKKENVEHLTTKDPLQRMKLFLTGLAGFFVLLILGIWLKQKWSKRAKLESVELRSGTVSQTHKKIYDHRTSLNLKTVEQIKTNTDPKFEKIMDSPSPKEIIQNDDVSQEKLKESGVLVLQIALKELKVNCPAIELLELAGEDTQKLTVYGIYLAARAKGVQVQGIKVELEYLYENPGVRLVFFHDESFALLKSIDEEFIELELGPKNFQKFHIIEFKEKWNGYVVTLSKI